MKREAAIDLYVEKNRAARKIVTQILAWSEDSTIKENSAKLKINYQQAYGLSNRYNLPFKPSCSGGDRRSSKRDQLEIDLLRFEVKKKQKRISRLMKLRDLSKAKVVTSA